MFRSLTPLGLAVCAAFTLIIACSEERSPQLVDDIGLGAFTDTTLEFPPMRYADGSLTINDRCPVRKVGLNRRLTPLFVNGKPLGFC